MKKFKTFALSAILAFSICGSLMASISHMSECHCYLICPNCGSLETNHYHPNGGIAAQVFCRTCHYEWIEENPEQWPDIPEDSTDNNIVNVLYY